MIEVVYAPAFLKQLKRLELDLQEEVREKIALFTDRKNHAKLKVHKLKGPLAGKSSFSVNYAYRIVFIWLKDSSAAFLAIGDHDVYA